MFQDAGSDYEVAEGDARVGLRALGPTQEVKGG